MVHWLEQKNVFEGAKFSVVSGKIQGKHGVSKRDAVIHPGSVVILPIYNEESILLIRNCRFAVNEVLWELPAGTLEPDESPLKTAERELEEESGYHSKDLKWMFSFYTTPGFCNEIIHSFVARKLEYKGQHLEDNETIEVENVTWSNIEKMIGDGTIKDGKTLLTLLWYQKYK